MATSDAKLTLVAHLIRSLNQFDCFFEVKFVTHILIETSASNRAAVLQAYAKLFYSLTRETSAKACLTSFLKQVIEKLTSSCQMKYLNYFLTSIIDVESSYPTDNESYLDALLIFGTPLTLQKISTAIRMKQVAIVSYSLGDLLKRNLESKNYLMQRSFWTLIIA